MARIRTPIRSSSPRCARPSSVPPPPSPGYAGVSFLHQPDGALANDLALREQLVREIRTFRPDAVLATDPETLFHGDGGVNHTDHRAAGLAAVDAVYPAARNPMAFPSLARSGLAAHVVRRLYLFWSNHANAWVDITHDARSQDRRPGRAPQPDPRPRRAREADPRLGGRGRRADRGRRGGIPAGDRHRRRRRRGPERRGDPRWRPSPQPNASSRAMTAARDELDERFPGDELDLEVWFPYVPPALELARSSPSRFLRGARRRASPDHPGRSAALVRRPARGAAARVVHPERELVRPGRLGHRAAAIPDGTAGP